jgi:Secretion system C-terminal sorting domain
MKMKIIYLLIQVGIIWLFATTVLFGQSGPNCFLQDFEPKLATIPPSVDSAKTDQIANVTVTINPDTLGKVSKYILGNAVAVWEPNNQNNPTLVSQLQQLTPALIRFPGGSWSDIYFWNGNPGDLPATLVDSYTGVPGTFYPQIGSWYSLNVDQYYNLREQIGAQGLITINYAYARYGTSAHPANQAAHYAADWVRYDNGRTKFWEIGNENGGPWEAGWRINSATSPDGQPDTISGALYGKHFKIFVDSMKAAAAEVGATIYIGAQINNYDATTSWNVVDHAWNAGVFSEVGDSADFYVEHNYLGGGATLFKSQVDAARTAINNNITFIRGDITNKGAYQKPVALTEWNCGGPDSVLTGTTNGVEAVVAFCEMIKNNYGMSCRWLVANGATGGMFYDNNPPASGIPLWNPRPDFYYISYLQRFTGDHVVSTTVTASPAYSDILAYATRFASGEVGVIVVNKNKTDKVVKLDVGKIGVGDKYYVYSLTGAYTSIYGLSQTVVVNGLGSTSEPWGPGPENLDGIEAWAYPIGGQIRFASPGYSVQYVMIETGSNTVSVGNEKQQGLVHQFTLRQNYPNPFNPQTNISYSLPRASTVTLKVYDILGREVLTLINNERESEGIHKAIFDGTNMPSGVYFYKLQAEKYAETKTMVLIK